VIQRRKTRGHRSFCASEGHPEQVWGIYPVGQAVELKTRPGKSKLLAWHRWDLICTQVHPTLQPTLLLSLLELHKQDTGLAKAQNQVKSGIALWQKALNNTQSKKLGLFLMGSQETPKPVSVRLCKPQSTFQ
jgi:hypothetical protein